MESNRTGASCARTSSVLRLVRGDSPRARFDGAFFARDDRFWPIADSARLFADRADWPEIAEYDALLPKDVRVHFKEQVTPKGKPLRRRPEDLYDARIAKGEIPTRRGSWHDYLNALVWATFPRSKAALHARQHQVISAWVARGGTFTSDGTIDKLPNARTREHDALALVDEGGIVVMGGLAIIFGHALYEGLVFGAPAMISRGVEISVEGAPDRATALAIADERLAERLAQPLLPEQLPRYSL